MSWGITSDWTTRSSTNSATDNCSGFCVPPMLKPRRGPAVAAAAGRSEGGRRNLNSCGALMKIKQRPEDFVVTELDRFEISKTGPFSLYRLVKWDIGTI